MSDDDDDGGCGGGGGFGDGGARVSLRYPASGDQAGGDYSQQGQSDRRRGVVTQVRSARTHLLPSAEPRPLVAAFLVVGIVPATAADYTRIRLH